ncbi:DUF4349 domain-containing protein [Paenibacillus ginsengihumi]|uniref:DUF4349 domain-containing protein n=1 Tax=Paenibacillus ginsengihumi TaxID=431596 RepID=UPI000368E0AD|nr:DUF4349 domain-containing protein [Paenibacillus ginsengihumi]
MESRRMAEQTDGGRRPAGGRAAKLVRALIAAALAMALASGCSAAGTSGAAEQAASGRAADSAGKSLGAANGNAAALTVAPREGGVTPVSAAAGQEAERKIIYEAELSMTSGDYAGTVVSIQESVRQWGGYVLQFHESSGSVNKSGTFVIKVPAQGFDPLLAELEKLAPLDSKWMRGEDVTEEFVDLESRLKAKQAAEERLLEFIGKASKTDELVAFSNELAKVQEDIEALKGRMRYLEQNVAYSTIRLSLKQKVGSAEALQAPGREPLAQRASEALQGTLAVLAFLFEGLVVIVVGALPVLALLLLILASLWLWRRKRRQKLRDIRDRLATENRLAADDGSEANEQAPR